MYLLITYDISSDKRRNKIDKLLSSYGFRVNYSVFELEVTKSKYRVIIETLEDMMSERDSVRIYHHDKATVPKSIELNPKLSNPFEKEASYV